MWSPGCATRASAPRSCGPTATSRCSWRTFKSPTGVTWPRIARRTHASSLGEAAQLRAVALPVALVLARRVLDLVGLHRVEAQLRGDAERHRAARYLHAVGDDRARADQRARPHDRPVQHDRPGAH